MHKLSNTLSSKSKKYFATFYKKILSFPERIFLLCGLTAGIILVFLTPPLQAADELAHLLRAYQVSDGIIFSIKKGNSYGGYFPKDILEWRNQTEEDIPIVFSKSEKSRINPTTSIRILLRFQQMSLAIMMADSPLGKKEISMFIVSTV